MGDKPPFVGRDPELATVSGALREGPTLVLVEGEAGIGKTRFVRECLDGVRPAGRVLVAACPPVPQPFPLGAVVDGLHRLAGTGQVAALGLSPLGGALRPLFPEWAETLPPALEPLADPNETRHRLLRALTELVTRLGVDVLVVEDAHWADSATLEWLLTLCAAAQPPAHVVVTYRGTDVPAGSLLPRLTSRVPAGRSAARIALPPLDVPGTRRLVGAMFGTGEVSEQFAAFLHERTGGLPLAVEECLRVLRDRRDIVRHGGRWARRVLDELDVPPTVRDSVRERVGRLDPPTQAVLAAAAVLAEPADERQLAAVADLAAPDAEQAVAAALAAGLLDEAAPGRFVFRHVLAAQAVGADLPVSRRRRMHARAARCLQQAEPAPVVRLARHLREAGDLAGWAHYAQASADLAMQSGDSRAAVGVLLDLLEAAEWPPAERARLARRLGEAAYLGTAALGGLAERVVRALRHVLAEQVAAPAERGEIQLLLGRMLRELSREAEGYAAMEAAVDDLGHRPDLALRAMANLAMPLVPDWPADRHLAWLDRAGALLARADMAAERLPFDVTRATTLLLLGEPAGWQVADRLPRTAASPAEQVHLARGLLNTAQAAVVWGRYRQVRERLATALEYLHAAGYQRLLDTAHVTAALLDWYTGGWDGLGARAADLGASEAAVPLNRLHAQALQGALEMARGHPREAERRLREVCDTAAALGVVDPNAPLAAAALARLRLAGGSPEAALQATERDMGLIAAKGMWWWATDLAPVTVDALVAAGQPRRAGDLVDQFAAGLGERGGPAPAAALLTCRAAVAEHSGDPTTAARLFTEAAGAWAALPRPYDELLATERAHRCALVVTTGADPDGALAALGDVQQRLRVLGARWDADRVARLLRRRGATVVRSWRRGPRGYGDQLSPRELEVVALLARGLTNRQIGDELFLSARTVGHHVAAAMRKLGVTTRTAVAHAAGSAGLLPEEPARPDAAAGDGDN